MSLYKRNGGSINEKINTNLIVEMGHYTHLHLVKKIIPTKIVP